MKAKTSAVRVASLSPNEVKIVELLTMEERRQVLLSAGRAKLIQLVNNEANENEKQPEEKPVD